MQEISYREHFAISQSSIKDFQFKSPKKWKEIYIDKKVDLNKNEDTFVMGSLVDTILFTPIELDTRFSVQKEKLPSKAVTSIMKDYYNRIINTNKELEVLAYELPTAPELLKLTLEHTNILIDCANTYCYKDDEGNEKCGWNSLWKDETRINNLCKQGECYFKSLIQAKGRKIISSDMNIQAIHIRKILHSNKDVMKYFIAEDGVEILFQLEIFGTYEETLPIKGALDIFRIDHNLKTKQIIDFKSSYSAFNFIHSIKQYGYCDQLSFYSYLANKWLPGNNDFKDYKELLPINIVIDINDLVPYIYEYTRVDLDIARYGNGLIAEKYPDLPIKIKKGWEPLLQEINWHYKNNLWEKPKVLYDNKKIIVNLLNN